MTAFGRSVLSHERFTPAAADRCRPAGHVVTSSISTVVTGLTSSVATVVDGCATPLAQGRISTLWAGMGWVWGTMDVAFLDGDLYILLSDAGPTWGSPAASSGVFAAITTTP